MDPQLVALALGIVSAVSALVMALFRAGFDAWRKGELIPRSLHDAIVKLVTDENARLVATNDVLRREYLLAGEEIKRLNSLLVDRADR